MGTEPLRSPPLTQTNPLSLLWKRWGNGFYAIVSFLFLVALLTNPLCLRVARVISYSTPAPKSGFWISSLLAGLLGFTLFFGRQRTWFAKAFMATMAVTLLFILTDFGLRMWPPLEVSVASKPSKPAHTNAWGYPSPEPEFRTRHRVLVLGDSITYGVGDDLNYERRYQDLLLTHLRKQGFDVDVQTVATPGWGLDDYVHAYEEYAPAYEPTVVVIGWCLNDIYYRPLGHQHLEEDSTARANDRLHRALIPIRDAVHFNEWYLWTVVSRRASIALRQSGMLQNDWLDDYNTTYQQRLKQWWTNDVLSSQIRRDLSAFVKECIDHNCQLVVLVFPYRFQVVNCDETEARVFRAMLTELKINYVDLCPSFVEQQRLKELFSRRDEAHPNAVGHQVAFDLLAPQIMHLLQRAERSRPSKADSTGARGTGNRGTILS
jgi:lysophospholipase L1-like esterase